jgi:hypothetical protein
MVTMRSAVHKSNCFHKKGHDADCGVYDTMYMVVFGIVQIFFSQVPNFHDLSWLSILAAIMSFSYSSIAVGLSLARTISGERSCKMCDPGQSLSDTTSFIDALEQDRVAGLP